MIQVFALYNLHIMSERCNFKPGGMAMVVINRVGLFLNITLVTIDDLWLVLWNSLVV